MYASSKVFWQAGSGIDYSNVVDIDVTLDQVQSKVSPKIRPIRNAKAFALKDLAHHM